MYTIFTFILAHCILVIHALFDLVTIKGMTFGAIIKDKVMFYKSFRNELIGVLVCFLTGAVLGFITAPTLNAPESDQLAFATNSQISSRGEWEALAWGAGMYLFYPSCKYQR